MAGSQDVQIAIDELIRKFTTEQNFNIDRRWLTKICHLATTLPSGYKDCMNTALLQLFHRDDQVVSLALLLIDHCVIICGEGFRRELAKPETVESLRYFYHQNRGKQTGKIFLENLEEWSNKYFNQQDELQSIPLLLNALKNEQIEGRRAQIPNQAAAGGMRRTEIRKVRAIQEFTARREEELSLYKGEEAFVLDDLSDPNNWEGETLRGRGIFPANLVSAEFEANTQDEKFSIKLKPDMIETLERKANLVLKMVQDANEAGQIDDPPELGPADAHLLRMDQLIDTELEKLDKNQALISAMREQYMAVKGLLNMKKDATLARSVYVEMLRTQRELQQAQQPQHVLVRRLHSQQDPIAEVAVGNVLRRSNNFGSPPQHAVSPQRQRLPSQLQQQQQQQPPPLQPPPAALPPPQEQGPPPQEQGAAAPAVVPGVNEDATVFKQIIKYELGGENGKKLNINGIKKLVLRTTIQSGIREIMQKMYGIVINEQRNHQCRRIAKLQAGKIKSHTDWVKRIMKKEPHNYSDAIIKIYEDEIEKLGKNEEGAPKKNMRVLDDYDQDFDFEQ